MNASSSFTFSKYHFSAADKQLRFYYQYHSDNQSYFFTETFTFPTLPNLRHKSFLTPLLKLCLIMFGVSYYKIFYAPSFDFGPSIKLNSDEVIFYNHFYSKGLGQFIYENQLSFKHIARFSTRNTPNKNLLSDSTPKTARFPHLSEKVLLLWGGGKESFLSATLLKKSPFPVTLFTINPTPLHLSGANTLGLSILKVQRNLDPKLLELNRKHLGFNGHVPVTGLYSALAVLMAIMFGFRYVVVSNERSSDEPNLSYQGEIINHQWSKSSEFESLFTHYIKTYIHPDLKYFSLLRGFSELAVIKKLVTTFSPLPDFFSCNRNFRINDAQTGWCGMCPKCLFVFLGLCAFQPLEEVIKRFGKNLLNDSSLQFLFLRLLGKESFKPLECLGSPQEVIVACELALKQKAVQETVLMKTYKKVVKIDTNSLNQYQREVFHVSFSPLIPADFQSLLQ